jgi:NTP pyrophosphatase (non-canonical NTP hydrolase)
MRLIEHQKQAEMTMNPEFGPRERMVNCALGLCDEAFEVAEVIFKPPSGGHGAYVTHKLPLDAKRRERLIDELGDIMWYASVLADSMGDILADIYGHDDVSSSETFAMSERDNVHMRTCWHEICKFAAKIASVIKKHAFQRHDLDENSRNVIKFSLNSIVQRVRIMAGLNGAILSDVLQYNIDKLSARYPDGKFSREASVHRVR